jgi:hypothetical protein
MRAKMRPFDGWGNTMNLNGALLAGAALALATALGSTGAQAANLITNGGFETGDFTGWTVSANATGVVTAGFDGEVPNSGTYFAALGDTSGSYPYGTLSQTVTDTAGQNLTLSYYLESDGATPNYFDANWNGVLIPGSDLTNVGDQRPNYVHYTFTVVGTGSDTLLFHEQNVPAYWGFDDVSLSTGGVPEPATWAMMLVGFAGLGAALRGAKRKPLGVAAAA